MGGIRPNFGNNHPDEPPFWAKAAAFAVLVGLVVLVLWWNGQL
ncbi:hypothetical protein [Hymenobacter koreensis]|uniref:Uncharacterized protein n=1 Tax=Hymenobacter koreensis TaxID=1084523 RepID=A0ABP8JNL1_9BACT